MALYKLSKSKTFHVDYCGCTAATLLLNEPSIQHAIDFVRQVKTKRDFVKTSITLTKDGIRITYNNQQKFSTNVPSGMIAGSAAGKSALQNTIGVVYISPLTGQHYPAFVHVYRCDSSHMVQKILARLRSYLLIENHRLRIVQLEEELLERNLLSMEQFNARKSQKPDAGISATNGHQRPEDPIKSITEELQKKIDSNTPILFPPKDYDTIHAAHGNLQRAHAWRSTEPTIVGYSPVIEPGDNRARRPLQKNALTTPDEQKKNAKKENNDERLSLPTHRGDVTIDPVETVSLAFDFLKDETSSIFNESDGNIEHLSDQQANKAPVYRFRPPQITAITKKLFSRNNNNNYDLTNDIPQSNSSSRNDLIPYHNDNQHQHRYHNQNGLQNGHRTRSETRLYYDQQPNMYLSPRYESRLPNGIGAPITTNPVWSAASPSTSGSQPNLLSYEGLTDSIPVHHQSTPKLDRRIPSAPLQHPLYGSYPDSRPELRTRPQDNLQKRSVPPQYQPNKKQLAQSQYLDTNEFILRASNGQPLRNHPHPNGHLLRDYRPHSMTGNGTTFDVYY